MDIFQHLYKEICFIFKDAIKDNDLDEVKSLLEEGVSVCIDRIKLSDISPEIMTLLRLYGMRQMVLHPRKPATLYRDADHFLLYNGQKKI